jgi:hypothetical protein
VRADARLQRLQPRLGERRGISLGEEPEVVQQRDGSEHAEQEHARQIRLRTDHRPHGRSRRRGERQHDEQHQQIGRPIAQAGEQRRYGAQAKNAGKQQRLEHRCALHEVIHSLHEVGRNQQRGRDRRHVDGEEHASDHPEVAEVGENIGMGVLPYTWHT